MSHELAQVEVAERVARDHEERLVELVGGQAHGARRAERRFLDRVGDVDAERVAAAEVAADRLRQERDRDDHVVEAVRAQQLEDVLHARLADDRDHRLRLVRGQRAQARPLSPGHDDGLHVFTSRLAFQAYATSAAIARPKPIQKMTRGQTVPLSVTIVKPSDAYSSHVAALPSRFTSKL